MKDKKQIYIIVFVVMTIIIWSVVIFKLSAMNTANSNGHSTNIISSFIEEALNITNKYNITSSYPSEEKINHASELINAPLRKVAHASVYFVLAFFLIIIINIILKNKRYLVSFVLTIVICFIFACCDELHQTFVVGRTGQFQDVIIDTIGSMLGCLFYGTYYWVYKLGRKSNVKILN